jgi:RimJ/RimL family protein N-acetyltransferase
MSATLELLPTTAASSRVFRPRDGRYLHFRRVTQSDAPQIADLLLKLSWQSRLFRYCAPRTFSPDDARRESERICRGAAGRQLTLLAVAPNLDGDEVLAVAELVPDRGEPTTGHLAIVVRDDYQRRGIGTALLRYLLDTMPAGDFATLRADLLAENHVARRLFIRLGLPFEIDTHYGETQLLAHLAKPAPQGFSPSTSPLYPGG